MCYFKEIRKKPTTCLKESTYIDEAKYFPRSSVAALESELHPLKKARSTPRKRAARSSLLPSSSLPG